MQSINGLQLHLPFSKKCPPFMRILKSFLLCSKPSLHSNPTNQTHQHPSNQNLTRIPHLLRHCNTIQSLKKAHALIILNGFIEHRSLLTETIDKYLFFGNPDLAISTYHTTHKPTLLLQNLTLRCLSNHGFYRDTLSLYAELQTSDLHRSDNFTFPFVIKACAALSCLRVGKEVHCVVLRTGYGNNLGLQTALLHMYAKNKDIESAKKVFDEIPDRDNISWNVLISGYSSNGFVREAFDAFQKMRKTGSKPSGSTFVSLIPMCETLGSPRLGRSLHCLALKCGAFADDSLVPSLISMYSGCEDLSAARLLFEMLPAKDIVSWNAMMSAYAQNRNSDEAFEVFRLMHSTNTSPNIITMVSVIPSSGDLSSVRYGESVHAIGIKLGLSDEVSVVSALVSMYAKLGEFDAARYLFHSEMEKNRLLYNSMISGCLLDGQWCTALDSFRDMQHGGVTPDSISMVSIISACAKSEDLWSGKSAHAYGLKNGFDSNSNVMNALLAFYSDLDHFSSTLELFGKMRVRNVISWNIMISGWARFWDTDASVACFNQMRREGLQFDVVSIISILPSFHGVGDLTRGISFHALVISNGYETDLSLTNALVSMYTNYGDVEAGYLLFGGLLFRSVVSWNALMTGCRNSNLFGEVILLFDRMKRDGLKPNSVTLMNLMPTCQTQLLGKSIHAYSLRNIERLESSLLTSIMSMYARFGNVISCRQLFETADKRSVVAWNTMMSAHLRNNNVREAVDSFREMHWMEVEPDTVTILNLISACSLCSSVDLGQCVTGFAVRKGLAGTTSVTNSLIDMYARFAIISMAKDLFDRLDERDSISWSVMINAYGMHGIGEAALGLFYEMRDSGVKPDDVTFVSVLSACSHAGLIEEGRALFGSMWEEHRIEPRMEHYACMVDLFGRTGRLDEAYEVVKRLPFRAPASVLESLLGACRCHGNAEVGEKVGELLIELDSRRASSYVMLSNIYASAGRWGDSGRLRSDMEGMGLRKDPGVSRIDVE